MFSRARNVWTCPSGNSLPLSSLSIPSLNVCLKLLIELSKSYDILLELPPLFSASSQLAKAKVYLWDAPDIEEQESEFAFSRSKSNASQSRHRYSV